MLRKLLRCKIHRATVTGGDLAYEGSITIDQALMNAAGLVPYEAVSIYNVTNGNRFETYAISGQSGSGIIQINGAAYHKAQRGDVIIIASYAYLAEAEIPNHRPRLVYVDERNAIARLDGVPAARPAPSPSRQEAPFPEFGATRPEPVCRVAQAPL